MNTKLIDGLHKGRYGTPRPWSPGPRTAGVLPKNVSHRSSKTAQVMGLSGGSASGAPKSRDVVFQASSHHTTAA